MRTFQSFLYFLTVTYFLLRVAQHEDDRVPTEEHLTDEAVLVDWLGFLRPLASLWNLRPDLLDVLEHHVAVAIESLHPPQQLPVVPAVDQNLRVGLHTLRQHRQRTGLELLLLVLLRLYCVRGGRKK